MLLDRLFSKNTDLDENVINDYIELSYSYYRKDLIHSNKISKMTTKFDTSIISNFVRFFRYINSSSNLDEEEIKDRFKNKPKAFDSLLQKINEIRIHQNTKVKFSDKKEITTLTKNLFSYNPYLNNSNIKVLCNFNWKINLIISNTESNRVLVPEILLVFGFSDGTDLKAKISLKLFQIFRKNLTFHIRKILENEGISLLK